MVYEIYRLGSRATIYGTQVLIYWYMSYLVLIIIKAGRKWGGRGAGEFVPLSTAYVACKQQTVVEAGAKSG